MRIWLFDEPESLRDLNERQELEKAKRALKGSPRQKELLLKEVDHRVKNSLQIVSSLQYLQAKAAGPAASQFHNAAARVAAITVHQQLRNHDDVGTVVLTVTLLIFVRGLQLHRAVPIAPRRPSPDGLQTNARTSATVF
jgi:two-component sensor histidine kinase